MDSPEDILVAAAAAGAREKVAELLRQGVPVDGTGHGRRTALDLAVWARHDDVVRQLLDAGADTEQRIGEHRETMPLRFAAERDHRHLARLLLDAGANPGGRIGNRSTPLLVAATQGNTAIAEMLLDHGADIHQNIAPYGTALEAAAWAGKPDTVRALVRRGAVVTARDLEAVLEGRARVEKYSRDPANFEHFPPQRLREYMETIELIRDLLS